MDRSLSDGYCVFRILDPTADNGIDVDGKFGVFCELLEFLVEHFETLLRNIVGLDVIDADLEVLEARVIECVDLFGRQQIPVRDHARDHSMTANAPDDRFDFRVQQRFSATNCYDGSFQIRKPIDAANHFVNWDGRREIVVFVTVSARKIASAGGNDVSEKDVFGGRQSSTDHLKLAPPQLDLVLPLHESSKIAHSRRRKNEPARDTRRNY